MRILLLQTLAHGHVYSVFGRSLQAALTALGHEAEVLDLSPETVTPEAAPAALVAALEATRYDAAVSFSSFFGGVTLEDGRSVFDTLGVTFVGWHLDHPIYARQSLAAVPRNRCAVYAHPDHLRYAQAAGVPGRAAVMPPGGDSPPGEPRPYASREWPVLVAATWTGEPEPLWEEYEEGPAKRLLRGLADRLMSAREPSVLDAFQDASAKLKLGMRMGADPAFDEVLRKFFCDALTYVRRADRLAAIRTLADAGVPLALCGEGWEEPLGRRPNVTFLGRVPFDQTPDLYGSARVVLNLNAANGGSERAISAALAGAAVVSDYGRPLDQLLGAGDGVAFFNRAKPATAAGVARRLLDTVDGERTAARGREKVLRSGLWTHRAQQLAELLQNG